MHAIRFDGKVATLDEIPAPACAEGEALVATRRVAFTGADAAAATRAAFEGVLGRRVVGEVVEVGAGADRDRWMGRRVVVSADVACGACDLCRSGVPLHCRDGRVLGIRGRDGALAERLVAPLRNLAIVPDAIDDDAAIFAEALAAAVHVGRVVRVVGKPYVTVLGDGVEGLLAAQTLARQNASVRVLGRRPHKFGLAEKWGVKHRDVAEVGLRADQDVVVEATGTPDGLRQALGLVRPRGKVVLMGNALSAAPAGAFGFHDLAPVVAGELELIGARGGAIADGVAHLAEGHTDVHSLITKRMRLADGAAVLAAAADPDQIAIVVDV
ncbi:MAG: alcohol dehydrogenase catalytic domain-containing protein [Planctomycetota bacterium]